MMHSNHDGVRLSLEQFDDLFHGRPEEIEKNLTALLPEAEERADKSIYLQILSQIALTQAMQQRFDQAHATLDKAEKLLEEKYVLARVRLLCERGRCFHQAGDLEQARCFFMESYKLSSKHGFDFHTVNAAHMIAIIAPTPQEKIAWNTRALACAKTTAEQRCKQWIDALYNNIAQNYIEIGEWQKALDAFMLCQNYAKESGHELVERGAWWGIARAKRGLGLLEEALELQQNLLRQYTGLESYVERAKENNTVTVREVIAMGRGFVYEELAELCYALSKKYAAACLQDWSDKRIETKVFLDAMQQRLERMKELARVQV